MTKILVMSNHMNIISEWLNLCDQERSLHPNFFISCKWCCWSPGCNCSAWNNPDRRKPGILQGCWVNAF